MNLVVLVWVEGFIDRCQPSLQNDGTQKDSNNLKTQHHDLVSYEDHGALVWTALCCNSYSVLLLRVSLFLEGGLYFSISVMLLFSSFFFQNHFPLEDVLYYSYLLFALVLKGEEEEASDDEGGHRRWTGPTDWASMRICTAARMPKCSLIYILHTCVRPHCKSWLFHTKQDAKLDKYPSTYRRV